jgi:tetratricopeptide (TPR) repeat protein
LNKGDIERALADYDEAIRLNPRLAVAYDGRAYVRIAMQELDRALADFDEAIRIDERYANAYYGRASVRFGVRDFERALADFSEAIRLDPSVAENWNARAWLRATCSNDAIRDGATAVEDAIQGCELSSWKNAEFLDTLSAAYAEAGRFDKAVDWQQKAVEMARNDRKDEFRARLVLYQEGRPFREPLKE